jgi:hypothetical protein
MFEIWAIYSHNVSLLYDAKTSFAYEENLYHYQRFLGHSDVVSP